MTDNIIRITWNTGEMEIAAGAIAFAPLAKLRKLIFPYLSQCSDDDKSTLISCITAEYRDAVRNRKTKNAEKLFARLDEFCTACGVDLPGDLPPIKEIPDQNFDIDLSKLPKINTLAAPTATIGRCTVPILHKVSSSCAIDRYECYAADGVGAMIDNIPCYAQKVKSNLYILNICGASAPIYQWRTISAAREGLTAAARECMARVASRLADTLERFREFCHDIPEPLASEPPAPDPDDSTDDIPGAVTPEPPKTTNRPKRHAAPSWVGVKMTAYPRDTKAAASEPPKSKKPDFVGRKMVITIGERSARPA